MKVYEMMNMLGKLPAGDEVVIPAFVGCHNLCGEEGGKCDSESYRDPEKMSWDDIEAIGQDGKARELLKLGARKTVELSTGEKLILQITDFDHDDLPDGGKAPISWDMVGVLDEEHEMNERSTNVGGWADCSMRKWLNNDLFDKLPDNLKNVIKPVVKKTSAGGESKEIVDTVDNLWLYSEKEMVGRSYYSAPGEGHWYELYRQEDTPWHKKFENGEGSAAYWWLRSPCLGDTTIFCFVLSDGARNAYTASGSYGVAVGFAI